MPQNATQRTFSWVMPWKSQPTRVEARFIAVADIGDGFQEGRLYFTPEGDATFWVQQSWNEAPKSTLDYDLSNEALEHILRCTSSTPPQERYFFELSRCFEVPMGHDPQTYFVALQEDLEHGGWKRAVLKLETCGFCFSEESFQLPAPLAEFCDWPAERIEAWLAQQCLNPDSELRLIAWWQDLDYQQWIEFLEERVVGLKELKQVMGWALLSNVQWRSGTPGWFLENKPVWLTDSAAQSYQSELPPFLARLCEFLKERFLPLSTGLPITPHCIQWQLNRQLEFETTAKSPTHHERLEAGLKLRDWLQENTTAEEFTTLWELDVLFLRKLPGKIGE